MKIIANNPTTRHVLTIRTTILDLMHRKMASIHNLDSI
jgi:hypothetical protein